MIGPVSAHHELPTHGGQRVCVGGLIWPTLVAWLLAVTPLNAGEAILLEDFEQRRSTDFFDRLIADPNLELKHRVGVDGGNALAAKYIGNQDGSERIIVTEPLARNVTECTLCFDVKFEEGFKYVQGGRLHGIGPDHRVVGQRPEDPDAWCARIRFRHDGTLETTITHQDQRRELGDRGNRLRPYQLLPGRYYAVSLHVRLNDPEANNGFTKLYVNGVLVEEQQNLRFRKVGGAASEISHAMFNTFYGGHNRKDAPRNPDGSYAVCHALFDNFAVYEGEAVRKGAGE